MNTRNIIQTIGKNARDAAYKLSSINKEIKKMGFFIPKTPINLTLDQYSLYMRIGKRKKKEVSKMGK